MTKPGHDDLAREIVPAGSWRSWDFWGMHTPSCASGSRPDGTPVERIYYTGRNTFRQGGPKSRYSIGVAERGPEGWVRRDAPILEGDADRPSVYEPVVRFDAGLWSLWYLSTPWEVTKGEQPDYEIRYTESRDGLTGWSTPVTLFTRDDAFFDNAVIETPSGWEMVLARATNLHGTSPFPAQGLWWASASNDPGRRESWTPDPVRLVNADAEAEPWFTRGFFGPSIQYGDTPEDTDDLYVFATGTSAPQPWLPTAIARLRSRKVPRPPIPFVLSVGRLTFPRFRERVQQVR